MKFNRTFQYGCARFLIATFSTVLIFASVASAQTDAATDVTKNMTISGETGLKWVNTGLTVVAGDTVRLAAKGEVDVGGSYGAHGPEGTTDFSEQPPGYYPLETKMRYGLAGRITLGSGRRFETTQTWVYGEAKEIKPELEKFGKVIVYDTDLKPLAP